MPRIPSRPIAVLIALIALAVPAAAATSTWTPYAIGSNGSPRQFYEFLPSAYLSQPMQKFPVVIFFHGMGESGDGTVAGLKRVCANGPAKILERADHPLHDLFEQRGIVVLCPQMPMGSYVWGTPKVRAFLDFALARYRIDPTRIWITGLSMGCDAVHSFYNQDPNADQVAAAVTCANRGAITTANGIEIAARCPMWNLTTQDDNPNGPYTTANNVAGFLLGTGPTTGMPPSWRWGGTKTGLFSPATGWTYVKGIDGRSGFNPKLSYIFAPDINEKNPHNSWDFTYGNATVWNWLFAQVKPTLVLSAPAGAVTVAQGQPVAVAAVATPAEGAAITSIAWTSSRDGKLGSGATLTAATLSVGTHIINCVAIDDRFCSNRVTCTVTVTAEAGAAIPPK